MRGFDYEQLARRVIDNSDQPVLPVAMQRQAMLEGANHQGEELRFRLRAVCERLVNNNGYKRVRVKGVSGYHYTKKA